MTTTTPAVYAAINAVQAALSIEGIVKDRKNQQQGYQFRGIDDIYNALAPMLAKEHLCILPRVLSRESVEHATKAGGTLFYVTTEVEFDFVSSVDGSKHTVKTFGEAMDSGDKATNKAMSAAYKYACLQTFCIPTEGDNDADATTHEVAARPAAKKEDAKKAGTAAPYVKALGLVMQATATEKIDELAALVDTRAAEGAFTPDEYKKLKDTIAQQRNFLERQKEGMASHHAQ